jgi:hypothetical protein
MNTTRRTFIKNGLGLVATGVALPSFVLSAAAAADKSTFEEAAAQDNLLSGDVYFAGSSFLGKVNNAAVTIETVNYFSQVADGKAQTGWTPMEEKGPHWLEMRWRYPVKISGFSWAGSNFSAAHLQVPQQGEYAKFIDLKNASGEIQFPEIVTDRMRFYITTFVGKPIVNELKISGPAQPLVPATLPGSTLTGAKIIADKVRLDKSTFAPLETINVEFEVSSKTALDADCYFIVELREKAPNNYFRNAFGDFEIAGTVVAPPIPTSKWQPHQAQKITAAIALPPYAPAGETFVSVMALTADGAKFIEVENSQYGDNRLAPLTIHREEAPIKVEEFPLAQLTDQNGQRGFGIGSKFEMPFFNRYMCSCDFERFHDIRANGLDIHYFLMYSSCIRPKVEWQDFIDRLDQQITAMLRVRPESYFMIGMDLRVTAAWLKENPDALMLNRDGKVIKEEIKPSGLVSYGSPKYLQVCYDFIDAVIDYINSKPYAGRVIGYYPYACSQNDAFIGGTYNNREIKERDKMMVGDFNPGAIQLFREWLQQKYFSVDKLQAAWRDSQVTFENAMPDGAALMAEDFPAGVFRDPVKSRSSIDYAQFFSTMIGNFYRKLAAHYKEKTHRKALVFMNYGAVLATLPIAFPGGARIHVNNNDLRHLLEDDNIDMFVQSMSYSSRNADDPMVVYQAIESINLHNKMYLFDYDARTIASGILKYGRHRSQHESEAIIKRDLSWVMMKNGGAWLADMSTAGWRDWVGYRQPWFSTPEVTKPTREVIELFAKSTAIPKKSISEIAVVVDLETPAYEDGLNVGYIYRSLITQNLWYEMTKLGAPYDIILKSDLANPQTRQDYKMYLMMNPFHLDDAERATINQLKRGGKTLVWFYAPGYISDDGLDVAGIRAMTGMHVQQKPVAKEQLQMQVASAAHPLTAHLEKSTFTPNNYAGITEAGPVFYVDDSKAQALAFYPDGRTAWAARDFGDWKSIYAAVPLLNTQAFRNIAKYAGVHLYVDEDVVMGADNRFLMFTNGYENARTLQVQLPQVKTVKDAFTGEVIAQGQKYFSLEMDTPQTRILLLE